MLSTDITKCSNEKCCLKEKCFRHTCESQYWQAYSLFEPLSDEECEFFINNFVEDTT